MLIPREWLPAVPMKRIIKHWTAGHDQPNRVDLQAYHLLITGDLKVVRGVASIALNSGSLKTGYAAHTLNCNTDSISMSLCGMAGAVESPWNPGRSPITEGQFRHSAKLGALLCEVYEIPVGRKTTLSHAEVEPNLGIRQRWKWDISGRFAWLPPGLHTPVEIGDWWRDMVSDEIDKDVRAGRAAKPNPPAPQPTAAPEADPIPEGARGRVTASTLNFRKGPGTNHAATGSLPQGTVVTVVSVKDGWLEVATPAGHVGWVARHHVEIFDGPPVSEPTVPDRKPKIIGKIRELLDELDEMDAD